jgi:hypothetical protein
VNQTSLFFQPFYNSSVPFTSHFSTSICSCSTLYHSQFQQACIIFIRPICSSALPHRIFIVSAQFLHSIRKFLVVVDELARTTDVDGTIPWCSGTTRTSAVVTASTLRGVGASSTATSSSRLCWHAGGQHYLHSSMTRCCVPCDQLPTRVKLQS